MHSSVQHTKVHRLFFVENDSSSTEEVFKIASDQRGIDETVKMLHQSAVSQVEFFGIYGEENTVKTYLKSAFLGSDSQIDTCSTGGNDHMPVVWVISNDQKIAFALIFPDDPAAAQLEKSWYFTVVMQRFLQDISSNILICPSNHFFTSFTDKHSFHSRVHRQRVYRQVKTNPAEVKTAKKIQLEDPENVKSFFGDQCEHVLQSDISPHTFCLHHKFEEQNRNVSKKFLNLKGNLQKNIHFDTINLRFILDICREHQIQVSQAQKDRITSTINNYLKSYQDNKSSVENQGKYLIKNLLGDSTLLGFRVTSHIAISDYTRNSLYDKTTEWLINPNINDAPKELLRVIIEILNRDQKKNRGTIYTSPGDESYFISQLQGLDRKNETRKLREDLINRILLDLQSENQFEVYYDLHQLSYIVFNPSQITSDLTIKCNDTNQIAFSSLAQSLNIVDLSESDRRIFARRIQFVACFKTYDGAGDILVLRRSNIRNKILEITYGLSIFYLTKTNLRKITDYVLDKIHVTYACNSTSQTLVLYDITRGAVTRCVVNSFGHREKSDNIQITNIRTKPTNIKSMALTVSQNLLVLIDSNSKIYSINLSQASSTSMDLLRKTKDGDGSGLNFVADNGELYDHVQTIGERSPVFFFQSKSCVDIIDQNYRQIQSIKLRDHCNPYKMQIFTDSVTSYCVLFNSLQYEVYSVQNLISDTHIERQKSSTDLSEKNDKYIGNRLLDVIKRGEIHFARLDSAQKTQYHFIIPSDRQSFRERILQYFRDLSLSVDLHILDDTATLLQNSRNADEIAQIIYSRVPLQLCTIEMGTLIPLNNGRRDRMDHLLSNSFSIGMKTREISFSYLDKILNKIDHNVRIVGIIGRQSTGKSYLMNRIFGTRFAVAAGRCTDGIWMSHAVCNGQEHLVLDCEGLFSDQRTEDEEIKLIAFLAAMCDVTILSQDLGFSRFQDRLFGSLSQAAQKIGKNEKLFQGCLLVAVRDISDANVDESLDAAEKKFMDLQRKGQSSFLEQLFSNTFVIQPLHHFENVNFDFEIAKLREALIDQSDKKRWDNGKDISDRMKILLVQLYTDDFKDSDQIQNQLKLSELEETMKKLWLKFDPEDDQPQMMEKMFQEMNYPLQLRHQDLQLQEEPMIENYEKLHAFLFQSLHLTDETKEKRNAALAFLDSITSEVLAYRHEKVKLRVQNAFEKTFPGNNDSIRDKRIKLFEKLEEYVNSFNLRMCLKKCSMCDLKCVFNAQHTENTKKLLEEKKQSLIEFPSSVKTKMNDADRDKLIKEQEKAKKEEDELNKDKVRLQDEQTYLMEKEDLQSQIDRTQLETVTKEKEISELNRMIDEMQKKLKDLMPTQSDTETMDQMVKNEIKALSTHQYSQSTEQKESMKQFYSETPDIETDIIKYHDHTKDEDLNEMITLMNTNVTNVVQRRTHIQSCLEKIAEDLAKYDNELTTVNESINALEKRSSEMKNGNDRREADINERNKQKKDLQDKLAKLDAEKKTLEEKIEKESQMNISDQEKIQKYIDRLQTESQTDASGSITDHYSANNGAQQLLKMVQCFEEKESEIEKELKKFQKKKSVKEKAIQDYKDDDMQTEIQEEEKSLIAINEDIEKKTAELNDLLAEKSSLYNDNELLKMILNQSRSNAEDKTRLEELCQNIHDSSERITKISDALRSLENKHNGRIQRVDALHLNLKTEQTKQEQLQQTIKNLNERQQIGNEIGQWLMDTEEKLNQTLKRLKELLQVVNLVQALLDSSNNLISIRDRMTNLKNGYDELTSKMTLLVKNERTCKFSHSKDYETVLEKTREKYDKAQQRIRELEDTLSAHKGYFALQQEITQLEKEAQRNCDCRTDHKCSGSCQICPKDSQPNPIPCMFSAGHSGEHKCNAGHVCQDKCQICQHRGDVHNQCHFSYQHQTPEYHQCERVHQCPKTCAMCQEPCAIPFDLKGHDGHQCSSTVCWKDCMFSCGRKCFTEDHSHDTTTELVQIAKGTGTVSMKKHLCGSSHRCLATCDTLGICKQEYKTQQKTWQTQSGEEFLYDHIEVNDIRGECEKLIPASQYSHDQNDKGHHCNGQHTCPERCPDCNAFCRQPYGHEGYHQTLHRNKDQHVFTSTNPLEQIEIQSNESIIRRYKIGESSQPENCSVSCKRRGRGHYHLVECRGGANCLEKKLGTNAKHSNDVYYYGVDEASTKKYDQVLCSTYWSEVKWLPPVGEVDRKLINSCNFFCGEHAKQDENNQIIRDSTKGFCTLGAWHSDPHAFECQDEHLTEDSYEGVDVCFVIDTTGSMASYIENVKSTITCIIQENETKLKGLKKSGTFQFGIVDYRDHPPEGDYVSHQCEFTDHQTAIKYVETLKADSGGDTPEAVLDGLEAACNLKWREKSDHLLFHVLDSPPHGKAYGTYTDRWPDGCPCGKTAENVLSTMQKKKIGYNVLLCSSSLNMMISEFQKYIDLKILKLDEISFEKIINTRIHQQLIDTEMTLKKFA